MLVGGRESIRRIKIYVEQLHGSKYFELREVRNEAFLNGLR
jgi:hypothetical protein